MEIDNDFENLFQCPICLEFYDDKNNKLPMILNCGHTICKMCLEPILKKEKKKCPNCNEEIKFNNINTRINVFTKFYLLNSFLDFPLKFKYCVQCKKFITNYSFRKHKKEKHYLFSFDKVIQSYFDKNVIFSDKDIFIVLYFYLNPFLHEIKYLKDIRHKFHFENKTFVLSGKIIPYRDSEDTFLKNLMKDKYISINDMNSARWFKGTLINQNNYFFIHGYFLIKTKDQEAYMQPIIFGFLNYDDIKFFGFIKVNKEYIKEKESLKQKDFILDCGLLLFNTNYYFGKFNEISITNLKKADITLLKDGEILNIKDNNLEVKAIIEEKKETIKPILIGEIIDNKYLYIKKEDKGIINEIEIYPFCIQENKQIEEYTLEDCKIILKNYNRTLILNRNNYLIYIFKNRNETETLPNKFKTKIFYINYTNVSDIISPFTLLKNYSLKDIKEEIANGKNDFFTHLKKVLEVKVETCNINYYECKINEGKIILDQNKYFEINGNKVKQINKINIYEDGIVYNDNNLKGKETIEDFLELELTSNFYNFNYKKKEEIICCNLL